MIIVFMIRFMFIIIIIIIKMKMKSKRKARLFRAVDEFNVRGFAERGRLYLDKKGL